MPKCSLLIALCLTAVKPLWAATTSPLTLVDKYECALADQRCFIFEFTENGQRESYFGNEHQGLEPESGTHTYESSGELATDGHRVALRHKVWGQYYGRNRTFTEENAVRFRKTFDSNEGWYYMKVPGDPQYPQHGRVLIDPDPLNPGRTSTPFDNCAGLDYPGHFLLGFVNETRLRMDVVLDNADSLTVRQVSEKVNGVDCYVLDFASKYGRGTLWLDPEHGYNIAQAEFHVKSGDVQPSGAREETILPNVQAHSFLRDVTFENVDGVWFPTSGTSEWKLYLVNDWQTYVEHHQISNIRLNADFDALGVFSKNDIENGALCGYLDTPLSYIWRDGQLIPEVDQSDLDKMASEIPALQEDLKLASRVSAPIAEAAGTRGPRVSEETAPVKPINWAVALLSICVLLALVAGGIWYVRSRTWTRVG